MYVATEFATARYSHALHNNRPGNVFDNNIE